ncbi:MAG TPA: hypothetical protein VHG71_06650 [Verrucomicrobiae bacterium]|nr:hypothetical protein [Verrucomicrobiae bacterium]
MDNTLTFENCVCFGIGMGVVYMMFRSMGVFVFLLLLSLAFSSSAQTTNLTEIVPSPLPVVISSPSTPDYWPAAGAGISFGFTVCGFGWVLRMARRVVPSTYE